MIDNFSFAILQVTRSLLLFYYLLPFYLHFILHFVFINVLQKDSTSIRIKIDKCTNKPECKPEIFHRINSISQSFARHKCSFCNNSDSTCYGPRSTGGLRSDCYASGNDPRAPAGASGGLLSSRARSLDDRDTRGRREKEDSPRSPSSGASVYPFGWVEGPKRATNVYILAHESTRIPSDPIHESDRTDVLSLFWPMSSVLTSRRRLSSNGDQVGLSYTSEGTRIRGMADAGRSTKGSSGMLRSLATFQGGTREKFGGRSSISGLGENLREFEENRRASLALSRRENEGY